MIKQLSRWGTCIGDIIGADSNLNDRLLAKYITINLLVGFDGFDFFLIFVIWEFECVSFDDTSKFLIFKINSD